MSTPELAPEATRPSALPVAASPPDVPTTPAAPLKGLQSTVLPDRKALLARAHALAAALFPQLQYRLVRIGIAGQAGLAALIAAAAVAVTVLIPAQHSLRALNADLLRARQPAAAAGMEQAVPRLMRSLPARGQLTGVIGQVFAQAKAAGVAIDKGRYAYAPAKDGGIAHYELEFPVKAPYPQIRNFIGGTLKTVPAAGLDKLRLERKAVGEEAVNADIGFVVFVRGESPPP